jgi:glutaminase
MYEQSGEWLYEVGLPGKSGVSGGIVTVAPGKGGLATFAPLLDEAGNSVKGQLAMRFLSRQLGLGLFASLAADKK